jgi:hypothetical protein
MPCLRAEKNVRRQKGGKQPGQVDARYAGSNQAHGCDWDSAVFLLSFGEKKAKASNPKGDS